jgi:hypothetical protein
MLFSVISHTPFHSNVAVIFAIRLPPEGMLVRDCPEVTGKWAFELDVLFLAEAAVFFRKFSKRDKTNFIGNFALLSIARKAHF